MSELFIGHEAREETEGDACIDYVTHLRHEGIGHDTTSCAVFVQVKRDLTEQSRVRRLGFITLHI